MVRKHWSRPQLIVLGRGRSEESVLEVCKYHDSSQTATGQANCGWGTPAKEVKNCHGVTGS